MAAQGWSAIFSNHSSCEEMLCPKPSSLPLAPVHRRSHHRPDRVLRGHRSGDREEKHPPGNLFGLSRGDPYGYDAEHVRYFSHKK